jgi:glycyl-tRNA synthetase beta chain
MSTKSLLVELFTEELPPKALKNLGEAFANEIFSGLEVNDFLEANSEKTIFATPRRLAVRITNVRAISQPRPQPPKPLMPVAIGLDKEGKPTAPLLKKLRSMYHDDVDIEWLMRERVFETEEGGKKVLKHNESLAAGSQLFIGLEGAIEDALDRLPIPKVMSYQIFENCDQPGWTTKHFVRPVHGLVTLHGTDVVPVSVLGLEAGRETQGHRFEAKIDPIVIKTADSYASQLREEGSVIANFDERRAEIKRQLDSAAAKAGHQAIQDDALLDEVTALVERPNVLVGRFEEAFLDVPQECLILTMKANQKYFPLLDASGKLTNQFLMVSNISPADPSAVIGGNERVVRPRLADAKFFFDQDRKKTLESRVPGLAKVVYHNKLGSLGERVERIMAIARAIGKDLGSDELAMHADRAALLAKADLLTDMVGEFPELQGVMGRYYALHDGESTQVAKAIEDHYKPRFAGDELPRNDVGVCVALADKLETLAGMFGIGQVPTGDKDPFALRRHALGVLRILIEKSLPLNLHDLMNTAFSAFSKGMLGDAHADVETFMYERLGGMLREQGYSANEVESVLCMRPTQVSIVFKQLDAVKAFAILPESASLSAANKRVGNILKKVDDGVPTNVNASLLGVPAEKILYEMLGKLKPMADAEFESGNYTESLQILAELKEPVDAFFDNVMVNAEDPALRNNRLALLNQLHQTMNRVADLSKLAV